MLKGSTRFTVSNILIEIQVGQGSDDHNVCREFFQKSWDTLNQSG